MSDATPPLTPARAVPTWFVRAPGDHRPALLQLPAARSWFELEGDEPGCWDRGVAWLPLGDRVAAVPLPGPPEVLAPGVLRGTDGTLVIARGGRLEIARDGVAGLDTVVRRVGLRFAVDGLDLPEGAVQAHALLPFARGVGVVWADQGWLYRLRAGEAPRAIGPFGRADRLAVGPDGAVLVGDGERWTRVAGPRSPLHALPIVLDADAPVRFARSGRRVAGVTADGDAVVIDTATAAPRAHRPGALPLSDRAFVEAGAPDVAGEALLASEVVVQGARLGGPGGRLWDLDRAEPVEGALLGPGPHAACGTRWATWEGDGVVRRLDARTGADVDTIELALLPGEEVVAAWGLGRTAVFATSLGRRVGLGPSAVSAVAGGEPPPPPGVPCPAPWEALGFERVLRHGDRTWAWSRAGLLAVLGA